MEPMRYKILNYYNYYEIIMSFGQVKIEKEA